MKKADASGKPSIFLLTPLREGRRASSQMRTNICGFLLTPLREGRPDASLAPELFTRLFLLTPLREGRHDLQSRITTMNRISTHAPAGGATKLTTGEVNTDIISTHAPAGGATNRRTQPAARQSISTHAPAGGATRRDWKKNGSRIISTHAPAGGATLAVILFCFPLRSFLLTPLREGRPDLSILLWRMPVISTHAPAGGATGVALSANALREVFLLTPLREGRPRRGLNPRNVGVYFYSRPCGRGDRRGLNPRNVGVCISTHAPAGGATANASLLTLGIFQFLLTPLREGRPR